VVATMPVPDHPSSVLVELTDLSPERSTAIDLRSSKPLSLSPPVVEVDACDVREGRNQMVMDHLDCVERFVRKYVHRGVSPDDLRQTAMLALVEAAERFDPDHGSEFRSFASATIDGTIKRYFRDRTWNVRPPRATQELHLRVRNAEERLSQELGHRPTMEQFAAHLDTGMDSLLEAMEAGMAYGAVPVEMSAPDCDGEAFEPYWMGEADRGFAQVEAREVLHDAIEKLGDRDQEVIRLRFVERLSQREIGDRLGMTQSYLSRVLRRALANLRAEIGEIYESVA